MSVDTWTAGNDDQNVASGLSDSKHEQEKGWCCESVGLNPEEVYCVEDGDELKDEKREKEEEEDEEEEIK